MRKADYFILARKLRTDIRAPGDAIDRPGLTQEDYAQLCARAHYAESLARYLALNLAHFRADVAARDAFLKACTMSKTINANQPNLTDMSGDDLDEILDRTAYTESGVAIGDAAPDQDLRRAVKREIARRMGFDGS